ncbi:MAG: ABC transporter ATP-binding protein [Chloroflexi bacterium]|nr:ABC transporter ATP-binding protein [Chloroflexota bacterium]
MATSDTTQDHPSQNKSSRPTWVDQRDAQQRDLDQEIFSAGYNGDVIRRFMSFVGPYRNVLILGIIAVIIFALSVLALPWIIRTTVNDVLDITQRDASDARNILFIMVGLFFGSVVLHVIVGYIQNIIVGRIAEHILIDLRRAMYEHLQRVSMSFMDKTEVGRMMARLQGDVAALQEFLETAVISIGDFLLLFGIVIAMLIMDWRLAVLTFAVVSTLAIVRAIWLPVARRAFLYSRQTSSIVSGALAENINGVRVVQGMSREHVNLDLFKEKTDEQLWAAKRAAKIGLIMIAVVDTLSGTAMAIIIVVGGSWVIGNSLEIGSMIAFILYVQLFFDPIRSITMHYAVFQRAMASGERIFEVLDVPIDIQDKEDAKPLVDNDGSVEFKNVTFGYLEDEPILKNINFRVEPGETVALVGPTGSGKTSITSLLHRFYDIWEGEILISGKDVRDVELSTLGNNIGMVLQEPYLFSSTIFENIRYNKLDATREEVVAAARAVGAHEFIMRLPNGYDTELEQRGGNLSLGQRQLISFARAIVADTKILILDEATASIDSYTELLIQQALARLLEGRTGIVIAHRLATIRGADRIIVLQNGEIIETGNHDELIAHGGLYARLYSMNYASFDDIPDELIAEAMEYSRTAAT